MTISQLIEELQAIANDGPDGDQTEVRLVSDYGDRGQTPQALECRFVKLAYLRDTPYSGSGQAVIKEGEEYEPEEERAQREAMLEASPIVVALGPGSGWNSGWQEVEV